MHFIASVYVSEYIDVQSSD